MDDMDNLKIPLYCEGGEVRNMANYRKLGKQLNYDLLRSPGLCSPEEKLAAVEGAILLVDATNPKSAATLPSNKL